MYERKLLCRGSLHISTAPRPILNARYSSRCCPQDSCGSRGEWVLDDGELSDDSFSDSDDRSSDRPRAGGVKGASTGDNGGGPMRGCPPLRAPVGSQGVLSLDIRGLTGWNALCLVPNSTTLVGCMLLLRWSSDAMVRNSRIFGNV